MLVVLCSSGYLINPGVMLGPWLPIYGFGAVIAVLIGKKIKNTLGIFLLAILCCGVGEYLTSWFLEAAHHARWWDYSDLALNINGRVCLWVLVIFAAVVVIGLKFIVPWLDKVYEKINGKIFTIILVILTVICLADGIYSIFVPHKLIGMPYDEERELTE